MAILAPALPDRDDSLLILLMSANLIVGLFILPAFIASRRSRFITRYESAAAAAIPKRSPSPCALTGAELLSPSADLAWRREVARRPASLTARSARGPIRRAASSGAAADCRGRSHVSPPARMM